MARRRKPISFDTTIRNPERIASFISILEKFEGQIATESVALEIEANIIKHKIFEPTKATMGTYISEYAEKFKYKAEDQSSAASVKVSQIFELWERSDAGYLDIGEILYLLKNTITKHKEKGWSGGWASRLHTQYNFLNELGLVYLKSEEQIKISEIAKSMINNYENGKKVDDSQNDLSTESAFLNVFSKYQVNNPHRSNTISITIFPLILNVIQYLKENYNRPGICKDDLIFIICWSNNDYKTLAEYINKYREKFGYQVSNEHLYEYALGVIEQEMGDVELKAASDEFISSKKKDFKITKLLKETPDEIVRKLRYTMLITFRGNGRFIDFNNNEIDKINHIINNYNNNYEFANEIEYFVYMNKFDEKLRFEVKTDSIEKLDKKEATLLQWSTDLDWEFIKREMHISVNKGHSQNEILKYIKETARFEFLSAIAIKKALPGVKVIANYKADDEGIPFGTASGATKGLSGADIDLFDGNIHATLEPTISNARAFQVEHEVPSIKTHLINAKSIDLENEMCEISEWFSIFLAARISRDVGDEVAARKYINNVEIFPWEIDDFINYCQKVNSLGDYREIREYAKIHVL